MNERISETFGVVIINWNAERTLSECVRSFRDAGVLEANIIVVDNGSTDSSLASLSTLFPSVHLLHNSINSYSRAVNLGAAALRLPLLVIANPDLVIARDCLLHIAPLFEKDADIGAIGCRLTDGDSNDVTRFSHTSVFRAIGLLLIPQSWRGVVRRREQRRHKQTEPFPVRYIEGSFLAVRRSAFDAVNGFDERYAFFHEDSDFTLRLLHAGWRAIHQPAAHATHYCGMSFDRVPEFRRRHFYRSTLLFFQQHYRLRYPVLYTCIMMTLHLKAFTAFLPGLWSRAWKARFRTTRELIEALRR
jgi:N-acetylglucosaminyl-diphospho-decaprenol L-rhamnosyltransferase